MRETSITFQTLKTNILWHISETKHGANDSL